MTGILGNFLKPENMDRLALGFNQLRMRPDAGLATAIQNRQALRQQQQGRDAAMEFFQGKPGADAYIAALGAGADGPSTIQSFITAQNAAARNNVGKVDRNRSIEILRQREAKGDKEAGRIADMIEAGGNAAQLLGIYYQGDVSGKAVQNTKEFGRGLSKVTLKNNTVKYYNNNVEITDPVAIGEAIAAEKAFDNEQAGAKEKAKAEGKGEGTQIVDQRAAIQGVANMFNSSKELIAKLYNHSGMAAATGTVNGARGLGTFGADNAAKEFITLHNQLAGKIFLAAFAGLKGGGQITEIEGQKATEALSNVNRQLDPPAYRRALEQYLLDLQSQVLRLEEELQIMISRGDRPALEMPSFEPDLG
jgi:hypothetical protein